MTRIMLLEDDSTMRSLLQTLFELEGFETHTYGAVPAGSWLSTLEEIQPNVLLMDVHLSNGSGLDLLKGIRQHEATATLPVAMISGENLAAESRSAGADYFFLKPFDTNELIDWIRRNSP